MTGVEKVHKLATLAGAYRSLNRAVVGIAGEQSLLESRLVIIGCCMAYGTLLRGLISGYVDGAMLQYIRSGQNDMRPAIKELMEPYIAAWKGIIDES